MVTTKTPRPKIGEEKKKLGLPWYRDTRTHLIQRGDPTESWVGWGDVVKRESKTVYGERLSAVHGDVEHVRICEAESTEIADFIVKAANAYNAKNDTPTEIAKHLKRIETLIDNGFPPEEVQSNAVASELEEQNNRLREALSQSFGDRQKGLMREQSLDEMIKTLNRTIIGLQRELATKTSKLTALEDEKAARIKAQKEQFTPTGTGRTMRFRSKSHEPQS